jgi:hypothetical protein
MARQSDNLVKVADGPGIEMWAWGVVLQTAGIRYRVVGDATTQLEADLPDPVELWVRRADAGPAEAEMAAESAAAAQTSLGDPGVSGHAGTTTN